MGTRRIQGVELRTGSAIDQDRIEQAHRKIVEANRAGADPDGAEVILERGKIA
jgi:hypothetical protein